jgi:hypothetical protein
MSFDPLAPLRFDGAAAPALAAVPPGAPRVLGLARSRGAAAACDAAAARWRVELDKARKKRTPSGAEGRPPPWLRILSPLPAAAEEDVNEEAVTEELRRHLRLSRLLVRAREGCRKPSLKKFALHVFSRASAPLRC